MAIDSLIGEASDAELILRVRNGDLNAYEQLWLRHIAAALRQARRVLPGHAEDLASEAFLALYKQMTTTDGGPQSAFRAYLFTSIRNLAQRWTERDSRVSNGIDFDVVSERDGLRYVEEESTASDMLAAFNDLPDRWQRVLWLSEIESAERSAIARELGIKPNAVSQLLRRARAGLRDRWLTQLVPVTLRQGESHVGTLLPLVATHQADRADVRLVRQHVQECKACAQALAELTAAVPRIEGTTLGVAGFAALGVAIPAASPAPAVTLAAGVTLLAGAASVPLATASVVSGASVLVIAGIIGVGLIPPISSGAAPEAPQPAVSATASLPGAVLLPNLSTPLAQPSPVAEPAPIETPGPDPRPSEPLFGRGIDDATVPTIDVEFDFDTLVPTPLVPIAPIAVDPINVPSPGSTPGAITVPAVTSVATGVTQLAPVVVGKADPGSEVIIAIRDQHYLAAVSDEGDWFFDFRSLSLPEGEYVYDVWAAREDEASEPSRHSFTVVPTSVLGFSTPMELDISEATTTGVVFEASGTPGSSLCVISDSGQSATIPVDATGTVVRRVRFLAGGFYTLSFAACADGYTGPLSERSLYVDDPTVVWGPFDPEAPLEIEISEVG